MLGILWYSLVFGCGHRSERQDIFYQKIQVLHIYSYRVSPRERFDQRNVFQIQPSMHSKPTQGVIQSPFCLAKVFSQGYKTPCFNILCTVFLCSRKQNFISILVVWKIAERVVVRKLFVQARKNFLMESLMWCLDFKWIRKYSSSARKYTGDSTKGRGIFYVNLSINSNL